LNAATLRRHAPAVGLALAIGLALRIAWTAVLHPDPLDGRFDDTAWYRVAAHYFARGEGYLNPYTGTPTAAWPPGYPAVLGASFKLFGESVSSTIALNVIFQLAAIPVAYANAALLFDRRTAVIGALAMAVWPGQIYFSSLTLSEPLFTWLFLVSTLLALLLPRASHPRRAYALAALFGIALAATMLTRGQALVLLPVATIIWLLAGIGWRQALAYTGLATCAAAICVAPWVLRNARELDSPVLISTNVGANLWIGNHAGATGRMQIDEAEPPQPVTSSSCDGLTGTEFQSCRRGGRTQGEYEAAADRLALREGLKYMATHPSRELHLAGVKIRALYEADSTALDWNYAYSREDTIVSARADDALRALANGFWFAMLVLAGVGLIASRSLLAGAAAMLPTIIVAWTLAHIIFFGDPRFHYPVVFVFAILGARGIAFIAEVVRRPRAALDSRYAAA
jgi:4-amino-4-deoxy-L-arabinose transferase-like glycosyltransferase